MGLIIKKQTLTPAQLIASQIQNGATSLLGTMERQIKSWFNMIWNSSSVTPDAAWAALGTNAVQARHLFVALIQIMASADSSFVLAEPSNWTLTENQDGSITAVKNS